MSERRKDSAKGESLIFKRSVLTIAVLACIALLTSGLSLSGCGNAGGVQLGSQAVVESATGFLDACGNLELDKVRSFFTQNYLDENQVPDPITPDEFDAAMGTLTSYRLDPDSDVSLQGAQAIVTAGLNINGKGERMETLILKLEGGTWKGESFTAMDWSIKPKTTPPSGDVEVEQSIRDFVTACIDGKTEYVFTHLSSEYKEKHHLEKAWTSAEFSGIFGTARSYSFNPQDIDVSGNRAGVDVTIEFGTKGNLESQTSRVEVVREGKRLIDSFPFFIY